jgi:hypothetical protein
LRKAKIEKEAKLIIHGHSSALDGTINKTMDDRMRTLEERVSAGASQAAKKK